MKYKIFSWFLIVIMVVGTFCYGERILTYLLMFPLIMGPFLFIRTDYCLGDLELFYYYFWFIGSNGLCRYLGII